MGKIEKRQYRNMAYKLRDHLKKNKPLNFSAPVPAENRRCPIRQNQEYIYILMGQRLICFLLIVHPIFASYVLLPFPAVRGFIIDPEHFIFRTGNLYRHSGSESGLDNFPDDLIFCFPAVKKGAAAGPEFAEIKFIIFSFIVELSRFLSA